MEGNSQAAGESQVAEDPSQSVNEAQQDFVEQEASQPSDGESAQEQKKQEQVEEMISKREFNRAQERSRKLEKQLSALEGPQAIHSWIQNDPVRAKMIIDLMAGKSQQIQSQEPQSDPYAEYDPLAAEAFRTTKENAEQIRQMREFFQQQTQQQEEAQVRQLQERADALFYEKIKATPYFNKETGEALSPEINAVFDGLGAYFLTQVAKDPTRPTNEEVGKIAEMTINMLKSVERLNLQKLSKDSRQGIPQTGSRSGMSAHQTKAPQTSRDRVNAFMNLAT